MVKIPLTELGLDCEKKELKDCPFCGGEASLIPPTSRNNSFSVLCFNNNCHADCGMESKEEVIKAWNTRVSENEKAVMVIDEEKLAIELYKKTHFEIDWENCVDTVRNVYIRRAESLSQNAKQFISIAVVN